MVMDGFIGRFVANIGVMRDVAEKAFDFISSFVRREKPVDTAESLTSRLQAAVALTAMGGRARLFGGADGILGVETRLIATDLGVEHAQRRAREGIALGRKGSGKDIVCRIVGAVLGRQFL